MESVGLDAQALKAELVKQDEVLHPYLFPFLTSIVGQSCHL